jgi:hypothetical protein
MADWHRRFFALNLDDLLRRLTAAQPFAHTTSDYQNRRNAASSPTSRNMCVKQNRWRLTGLIGFKRTRCGPNSLKHNANQHLKTLASGKLLGGSERKQQSAVVVIFQPKSKSRDRQVPLEPSY